MPTYVGTSEAEEKSKSPDLLDSCGLDGPPPRRRGESAPGRAADGRLTGRRCREHEEASEGAWRLCSSVGRKASGA